MNEYLLGQFLPAHEIEDDHQQEQADGDRRDLKEVHQRRLLTAERKGTTVRCSTRRPIAVPVRRSVSDVRPL